MLFVGLVIGFVAGVLLKDKVTDLIEKVKERL